MIDGLDQTVMVSHAFALVVALLSDSAYRAALDAGGTSIFRHTVFIVLSVAAFGWFQREIDNDRTKSSGFSFGGD